MKHILFVTLTVFFSVYCSAQKQTFDLTTFIPPAGWKKETTQGSVQFSKQDLKTKNYCILIVMKSIPGTSDAKENFNLAWESIVKNMVEVSATPTLQPSETENGWEAQSGFANYADEGQTGVALLVTNTGFDKMVNIVALTNTDKYQDEMNSFFESITLKKITTTSKTTNQTKTPVNLASNNNVTKSKFAYTTTNFEDGWVATEQSDWVRATKGTSVVLVHYSLPDIRSFNNLDESTAFVWNTLVAPRYKNLKNFWNRKSWWADGDFMTKKYYAEGDLIENSTGKQVYVVLYKNGNSGKWIEIITPDKASFQKQFTIVYQQDGTDWDKLSNMGNLNKFAVAASDIIGNWKSASGAGIEYVNIYTGNSAGMASSSSTTEFFFKPGNTYTSIYKGVMGSNGANQYHGVTYNGKSIVTNWEMKLTNRFKGATETFTIQFEAVKGGRILHMYRGSVEELHLFKLK